MECVHNNMELEVIPNLIRHTPIALFYSFDDDPVDPQKLANLIDIYLKAVINKEPETTTMNMLSGEAGREITFMAEPLRDLDSQVETFVMRDISNFKRTLLQFHFKSPLNFIMMGSDFHEFFGVFYHAKLLTQYLTNILSDSVFSLHRLHSANKSERK